MRPRYGPPSTSSNAVRVLLIEAGVIDRGFVARELYNQGFAVVASLGSTPGDAFRLADVVVLHCDGAKTPRIDRLIKLHRVGSKPPLVLLTSELSPAHECRAFDHGAVDVIRTSQGLAVLAKRIKNVVKDLRDSQRSGGPLTYGELLLRPDDCRAYWKDVDLDLSVGEYKVVHLLASNEGRHMTFRAIYDRVHHEGSLATRGDDGYRTNVRSMIKRIRIKFLECDPTFDEIESYSGFGYRWKKPARGTCGLARP